MEAGGLSQSSKYFMSKVTQDLLIYKRHFKINFIFFYIFKIIYKLYKLIVWKIRR